MFKETFKYYKAKQPAPCFDSVIDFHNQSHNQTKWSMPDVALSSGHLQNTLHWEVYNLPGDHQGFIYVRNAFTSVAQQYWIRQCLAEFTKKPARLNVDALGSVPGGRDWWEYARDNRTIRKQLRWSTLGYHHNWDTKVYDDACRSPMPADLVALCADVSKALRFTAFRAEAAIVNFYHLDSTLSGHTDHSEQDLRAPLFSFSFGNSAIFLLGGRSLDERPIALFIHSGDIVVMSGESRMCYHAVPRIVKTSAPSWHSDTFRDESFRPFSDYIESSRININVRQVLPAGCNTLSPLEEPSI